MSNLSLGCRLKKADCYSDAFFLKVDLRLLEPRPSHSHLEAVVIQCDILRDGK